MDIKLIKEIINSDLPEHMLEKQIISILSQDEKVIPEIMKILEQERKNKKELIADMNLELSRAHVYIDMRPESKSESKDAFSKTFVIDKISEFYIKYKSIVQHCFNRFK